jgi:hypothetical protein
MQIVWIYGAIFSLICMHGSFGFVPPKTHMPLVMATGKTISIRANSNRSISLLLLFMGQIPERAAKLGIDKVVTALRNDKDANTELGRLVKVTTVLGYGSPSKGTIAVRFNASFQKSGMGRSSVPLPFGLGQSDVKEGRGTMVGQVKASLDEKTGKLISCSVFRDLGYGRAFNLKV